MGHTLQPNGRAHRKANQPNSPPSTFLLCLTQHMRVCGKKKKNLQSILTASLFLGVCIKPLCFEDDHNELSWADGNAGLRSESWSSLQGSGEKKKKTDTDVLISAIIHKILTHLTGWCKVQMIIPIKKLWTSNSCWFFDFLFFFKFWISSFFVLPHPYFQNCSSNWGFGENSILLKLCHPK